MARLVLIFVSLTASLAWGAPNNNSEYNDDWDDVWSDWGTPTDEVPKETPPNNNTNTETGNSVPAANAQVDNKGNIIGEGGFYPSDSEGGGFGSSDQKRIQFRLVREGSSEPEGVRKYRPTYGKRKRL